MDPATMAAIGSGMQAAQGIAAIIGGISARKDAKKAARSQARLNQKVTSSKLADLFAEERVLKGQTIAAIAGSGVKYAPQTSTSSPMEILMEQAKTFERERRTVAEVGAMESKQILQRGRMVGNQALYAGIAGGTSSIASAFSIAPGYVGKQPGKG